MRQSAKANPWPDLSLPLELARTAIFVSLDLDRRVVEFARRQQVSYALAVTMLVTHGTSPAFAQHVRDNLTANLRQPHPIKRHVRVPLTMLDVVKDDASFARASVPEMWGAYIDAGLTHWNTV